MSVFHMSLHRATEVRLHRSNDPNNPYLCLHIRGTDGTVSDELTVFGEAIRVYDADGRTLLPVHVGSCTWPSPSTTDPVEPHWIEAGYDNAAALGRLHGRERPSDPDDTEEGA